MTGVPRNRTVDINFLNRHNGLDHFSQGLRLTANATNEFCTRNSPGIKATTGARKLDLAGINFAARFGEPRFPS